MSSFRRISLQWVTIWLFCSSFAHSDADTHFVSPKGAHVSPFLSWLDAATNIQAAVDVAEPGDDVLVTNAVYQLDKQVVVSNGICMIAFPHVGKSVLDAQDRDRCVYLTGSNTSVMGFTLRHGNADYGGGACCEAGSVRYCTIASNTASVGGGLYHSGSGSSPLVDGCTFTANTALCGGGACVGPLSSIAEATNFPEHAANAAHALEGLDTENLTNMLSQIPGGPATVPFPGTSGSPGCPDMMRVSYDVNLYPDIIRNCEFIENTAICGGGLCIMDTPDVIISNCVFAKNTAELGGGICALNAGAVAESTLVENEATMFGGGMLMLEAGLMLNCHVLSNRADLAAGGLGAGLFDDTSLSTNLLICGTSTFGADPMRVLGSDGGSLPVDDCRIENNYANGGGGIALFAAALVRRCTITGNTAGMAGGGVLAVTGGEAQSSLVCHNAAGDGAGVYCFGGGDVFNSTVTVNDALNSAGGIFVTTSNLGGGWHYDTDTVVANCIVYGNTASNNANLRDLSSNATYFHTCTFPSVAGTGNITNTPQLSASYRLGDSSPCLDAGNNTAMAADTDLDGLPRPLDGDNDGTATVDMGCYEYLHTAADTDGDAMLDGWEFEHGLNLVADDSGGDADNDTISNGGEYAADTDPQDGDSVLSIISLSPEMGGIRIDWKGGEDAWQFLECCSNLASTTDQWTAILAVPPPTPMTNAIIDLGATGRTRFYRIRAER